MASFEMSYCPIFHTPWRDIHQEAKSGPTKQSIKDAPVKSGSSTANETCPETRSWSTCKILRQPFGGHGAPPLRMNQTWGRRTSGCTTTKSTCTVTPRLPGRAQARGTERLYGRVRHYAQALDVQETRRGRPGAQAHREGGASARRSSTCMPV